VLPFKSSLVAAAAGAGTGILPVCIRYTAVNGEPFSPENRDRVCWYGEMSFFPHLLKLLAVGSLRVNVRLRDGRSCAAADRKETARRLQECISAAYREPAGAPGT